MRVIVACLFASVCWVQWAQAQHTSVFDMNLPAESVAGCEGASCLLFNPAGLGSETELVYLHSERWGREGHLAGSADGLFVNAGAFGFGLQYLRPVRSDQSQNLIKYNLMVRLLSLGDLASFGGGLEILDPTENDADVALDYMLAGLIRPWRYLSLGVVGRNLANIQLLGKSNPRSVDLGLSMRPLWFAPERLTLSVDYRFVDRQPDPPVRLTLQTPFVDGLSLMATADLDGDFGVGLMVDFMHVGAGAYTGFVNARDMENDGVVLMARASVAKRPGFRMVSDRTLELVLSNNIGFSYQPQPVLFGRSITLFDIERAIRSAALDDRFDSVLIKIESNALNMSQVQELRAALMEVKAADKKVFFYLYAANNTSYHLACLADRIYLHPAGRLTVTGPRIEALFIGGTLEMVGVRAEATRAGKYKSAVEMYTRQAPSKAYLKVMNSLADEFSQQMNVDIANGRGLAPDQVALILDRGLMQPEKAEEAGLVDGVIHYDQIDEKIQKVLGHPLRRINTLAETDRDTRWGMPPRIVVVHASGTIQAEAAGYDDLDASRIASILQGLSRSSAVDAVVLRVDSPGGSGLASDLIWRQVVQLRKNKPVIVSMGSVAASGGYYIACPADWIVANPATITGSIGAYSLLIDASELLANVGVSREVVSRGKLADIYSVFRSRNRREKKLLQEMINSFYEGFVSRVAKGRKLSTDQVDKLAQGRVWTGRQAKQKGLVDELGGLSRAISIAKQRIGLGWDEPVQLIHLPKQSLSLRFLLDQLGIVQSRAGLTQAASRLLEKMTSLYRLSTEPFLALLPVISIEVK